MTGRNPPLHVVLATLLLGLLPAPTRAGGFANLDLGIRRCGMMGVVARADDLTAIYHNVAGLADQRGTQFYGAATSTLVDMGLQLYRCPGGVPGCAPADFVVAPADRKLQPTSYFGIYPFLGLSREVIRERLTVALAAYAPNFYGAFLPNERWAPSRYHITEGYFVSLFVTAAAGVRVTEWLDLGLGVSYIHVRFKMRRALNLFVELDPSGEARFDESRFDGDGYLDAQGTDHAVGMTAGLVLKPHPRLRLGFSWMMRTDLFLEGRVSAALARDTEPLEADFKTNMVIPTALRAGVNLELMAPRPAGFWRGIEFGLDYSFWEYSVFSDQRLKISGEPSLELMSSTAPKRFRDSHNVGGGFLFRIPAGLELLLGGQYDWSPTVPEYRTIDASWSDIYGFSLGARWSIPRSRWRLGLAYVHNFYQPIEIRVSRTVPPSNASGHATTSSFILDAGFRL